MLEKGERFINMIFQNMVRLHKLAYFIVPALEVGSRSGKDALPVHASARLAVLGRHHCVIEVVALLPIKRYTSSCQPLFCTYLLVHARES